MEDVLNVERPERRRGLQLNVLVRWRGDDQGRWHGGSGGGERWADSWESVVDLGAFWKVKARQMEKAKYGTSDDVLRRGGARMVQIADARRGRLRQAARDRRAMARVWHSMAQVRRRVEARRRGEDAEEEMPERKRRRVSAARAGGPNVTTRARAAREA